MSLVGRPNLSDEIKKARGTDQNCRLNPDQPVFTKLIDAGEPPEYLGEAGKDIFRIVTQELINANVLQLVDINLVILLADKYDDYYSSMHEVKSKGKYIVNMAGEKKINPALKIKDASLNMILRIAGQLGLSPAARQRIRIGGTQKVQKKSTSKMRTLKAG
jgi:P27 family predicted phage terminase small subunit